MHTEKMHSKGEDSVNSSNMPSKSIHKESSLNICRDILICFCIVIAILTAYWQVRNFAFVGFDDDVYVFRNRHVQAGLTLENIIWSFSLTHEDDRSHWHPLTWLSHMLDCQIYGLRPGTHHLTSLLFHIANCVLLFLVFRWMTGAVWRSAFVAALFALHPLNVDSVAWVAQRKNVLSTFFWMLTMLSYVHFTRRPGIYRYLLVCLIFALGLMAKPMLVTLPFVLLLLDYWPLSRLRPEKISSERSAVYSLVLEKVPLFVLSGVSVFLSSVTQLRYGVIVSTESIPMKLRVANALVSYVRYIGKMIWPQNLAFFYPYPTTMVPIWQIVGAGVLLICVTVLIIGASKRIHYLGVGWLWYLGTLIPVIGLIQAGVWPALADRWTYVPLIGLFIIIAWGVPDLAVRWRKREVLLAITAAAVLSILMAATWLQTGYWTNSTTLFEHALEVTDNNYLAHNNLGVVLVAQGKIAEAIDHYSEALRIRPGFERAHYNLGGALIAQGKLNEAIHHYTEALRLSPNFAGAHYQLGIALARQGRITEAIDHYSAALKIEPNYAKAHNNLGFVLAAQGKLDEAISHYSAALLIRPDYAKAHNNLGVALAKKGNPAQAITHFSEALRLRPDFAEAHTNLKTALAAQRKIEEAIAKFQRAIKAYPQDPLLHYRLGSLYQSEGEWDQAVEQYKKALSVQPGFTRALNNLATLYTIKGDYGRAVSTFEKVIRLRPEYAGAYYNIACIYARQNRIEESIDWLKKAIEMGYDKWDLIKTDKDLESIRVTSFYKELIK